MSNLQIFVILSGIVMTILISWYFWFAPKARTRVAVSESGAQEVAIIVKGGYTPDVIVVQKGRPVEINVHTAGKRGLFRKSVVPRLQSKRIITRRRAGDIGIHARESGRVWLSMSDGHVAR